MSNHTYNSYGRIYLITNRLNEKKYVGQTVTESVEYRWAQHKRDAKNGALTPLHRAIRLRGEDSFTITQLHVANTQQELDEKGKFFIRQYQSDDPDFGYNVQAGGQGVREADPEIITEREAKTALNSVIRSQQKELKKLHYQLDREELQARLAAVKKGLTSSDSDVRKRAMLEYDLYYATRDMERAVATAELSWATGKAQRAIGRDREARRGGPIIREDGRVFPITEPKETAQEYIARKTQRVEILKARLDALKPKEGKQ